VGSNDPIFERSVSNNSLMHCTVRTACIHTLTHCAHVHTHSQTTNYDVINEITHFNKSILLLPCDDFPDLYPDGSSACICDSPTACPKDMGLTARASLHEWAHVAVSALIVHIPATTAFYSCYALPVHNCNSAQQCGHTFYVLLCSTTALQWLCVLL
jgi:hypothetical protein